jgi:putative phosphoesterase
MHKSESVTRSFMKALIFSDSHGKTSFMKKIVKDNPTVDYVFFLGDGLSDADTMAVYYTDMAWVAVRGNCDFSGIFRSSTALKTEEINLMGKRIVLTHGDLYGVKYGLDGLKELANTCKADIVLFGHTHRPHEEYVSGEHSFYLFNPGSISMPSYSFGVLTLEEDCVLFSHGKL